MKKILYVTTVSSTINTFLIPHIKHLIDLGNEVQIASSLDQEISRELIQYGVKFNNISFSRNPINISNKKALNEIRTLYNKEKFDIVHVHTPVASFVTRFALKNENIKMIYTCHGFHFYKGAPLINWMIYYPLERMAANWTDTLVTINSEDLNIAKNFKLRSNGQVQLMHGVGIDLNQYKISAFNKLEYRKSLGLDEEDFVILVLSELNKNKNHIQIIKAMNLLKKENMKIKVLCAGKGPLEDYLKNEVEKLGLEKNIMFLGFRNDVSKLINICDCVALLSKREGLGKCLLEGMYAEKQLLATNTRGPRELISHGENGFLIEVGDINNTAECIKKLYFNTKNNYITNKRNREKIRKYCLENVLNKIEEINCEFRKV